MFWAHGRYHHFSSFVASVPNIVQSSICSLSFSWDKRSKEVYAGHTCALKRSLPGASALSNELDCFQFRILLLFLFGYIAFVWSLLSVPSPSASALPSPLLALHVLVLAASLCFTVQIVPCPFSFVAEILLVSEVMFLFCFCFCSLCLNLCSLICAALPRVWRYSWSACSRPAVRHIRSLTDAVRYFYLASAMRCFAFSGNMSSPTYMPAPQSLVQL